MELRHLIYFRAVAESLHFSKAAERLHISQPPLTRQIKELEAELGVLLFQRNNKRVTLTEAGKYFFKESELLLKQLERTKRVAKQIHDSVNGEFQIGYISSTPQSFLVEILQKLKNNYPVLKTRLYELPTTKQIKALEEGKLDVGILRAPISSTQLEVRSLWQDTFSLVHAIDKTLDLRADHLSEELFVSYNSRYAPHYHEQFIACCHRIGFHPQVMHECNNMHSILGLVENRLGIAFVPSSIKSQYPYLKLKFTALKNIPVFTEIVMAHHRSTQHPALNSLKEWSGLLSEIDLPTDEI